MNSTSLARAISTRDLMSVAALSKCSPCSVANKPRAWRWNNGTLSSSSRPEICRRTADWLKLRTSPALVKLPASATTWKIRSRPIQDSSPLEVSPLSRTVSWENATSLSEEGSAQGHRSSGSTAVVGRGPAQQRAAAPVHASERSRPQTARAPCRAAVEPRARRRIGQALSTAVLPRDCVLRRPPRADPRRGLPCQDRFLRSAPEIRVSATSSCRSRNASKAHRYRQPSPETGSWACEPGVR